MKTRINATQTISAVIIRADGSKEDLGVISKEKIRKIPTWLRQLIKKEK